MQAAGVRDENERPTVAVNALQQQGGEGVEGASPATDLLEHLDKVPNRKSRSRRDSLAFLMGRGGTLQPTQAAVAQMHMAGVTPLETIGEGESLAGEPFAEW